MSGPADSLVGLGSSRAADAPPVSVVNTTEGRGYRANA
jgi:hypothetical protein